MCVMVHIVVHVVIHIVVHVVVHIVIHMVVLIVIHMVVLIVVMAHLYNKKINYFSQKLPGTDDKLGTLSLEESLEFILSLSLSLSFPILFL